MVKKALFYIATRLAVVLVIVGIVIGAFFSSMKTSNVYFLLNDALKARLDVIVLGDDMEDRSKFFSYNYLQGKEYSDLKEKYSLYIITNYGHKLEYSGLFVWPWQKSVTVTVKEAVFAINGELDTTQMSKADAMAHDLYNVPAWNNSVYRVKLIYENGSWLIDSVTRRGDFDYSPPTTPSLTEDEIEALRTPAPTPTPTPDANATPGGNKSAIISSAISGDKINLREGPMTEYEVVAKLETGTKITVLGESDGWYYVETADGKKGYVSGYYVSFSN